MAETEVSMLVYLMLCFRFQSRRLEPAL